MTQPSILRTLSVYLAIPLACAEPGHDHDSTADVRDEDDLTGLFDTGDDHSGPPDVEPDTTVDGTVGCSIRPTLTDLSAKDGF